MVNLARMKKALIIIGCSLLACLYACKKYSSSTDASTVTGKWNVVSDSTYAGVGLNNHPVDYQGKPGDYFDFRTSGTLYTKEGTVLDTLSYHLLSDTAMIIQSFGIVGNGIPETSHITIFTAHQLVIKAPTVFTPGGIFGRTTALSR